MSKDANSYMILQRLTKLRPHRDSQSCYDISIFQKLQWIAQQRFLIIIIIILRKYMWLGRSVAGEHEREILTS
jgi:hypothetical protein